MAQTGKFLGAILVGDNQASRNFLAQKKKTAEKLAIDFRIFELAEEIGEENLETEIKKLVNNRQCGGLIIQLPLPKQFHQIRQKILDLIPVAKDPDVLSSAAFNLFVAGTSQIIPPPAGTVEAVLSDQRITPGQLARLTVALIGRGLLIGRPIEAWLKPQVAKLLIFDSRNLDFKTELSRADVIISGTGRANLFDASDLQSKALVIDFGYGRDETGKIAGDFDSRDSKKLGEKNITYTPTPGGTGPILVGKLFENFLKLNA